MASFGRKPKQIRKKISSSFQEEGSEPKEETTESVPATLPPPIPVKASTKTEPNKPSTKKLLSFDVEEQPEDSFQLTKKGLRQNLDISSTASHAHQSSHYSMEQMEKLKKSTYAFSVPKKKPVITINEDGEEEEVTVAEMEVDDPKKEKEEKETNDEEEMEIMNADQVEKMEEQEEEEDEEFKEWEMQQIKKGGGKMMAPQKKKKPPVKQLPILTMNAPQLTVEQFTKNLEQSLYHLESIHELHSKQLKEKQNILQTAKEQIQKITETQQELNQSHSFFHKLKGYISNLCDCLEEKAPKIEDLEDELAQLDKDRVEVLDSIYSQNYWFNFPSVPSTEEYFQQKNKILEEAKSIFADTVPEFSSLTEIKKRLEAWKFNYPRDYKQAYAPISMPLLFAPFVRLECLFWDPLSPQFRPFTELNWYQILANYGIKENEESAGEDEQLIPKLVEMVIIPKVVHSITYVWNPRSSSQTERLINLVSLVSDYVPPSSESFRSILSSLVLSMQGVVDKMPPLKGENLEEVPIFVKNCCQFFPLFQNEILPRILIEDLLNTRVLPFCNQRAEFNHFILSSLEKWVHALPKVWLVESRLGLLKMFLNEFSKRNGVDKGRVAQLSQQILKQ